VNGCAYRADTLPFVASVGPWRHKDGSNIDAKMLDMRTTVRIDPELAARLRRMARERGISFSEALNSTLRIGVGQPTSGARPYRLRPRRLGLRPTVDLDRGLRLAAAMEDEETIRKLELRT
jgi:hypothetical protein